MAKINPRRLTEARQVRGLNISELSKELEISRQAVSKYEQNGVVSDKILNKICDTLDFPFDFFLQKDETNLLPTTTFFRSMKSTDASIRTMVDWKCTWAGDVVDFIDQYIVLPKNNLPLVDIYLTNRDNDISKDFQMESIEELSFLVRKHWNLGEHPIKELLPILEKNGIVVSGTKMKNETIDACSKFIKNRPVIFLGNKSQSIFRQNFTLAHELGHILMHRHITIEEIQNKKVLDEIEKEANYFASCFLMPANTFFQDVHCCRAEFFKGLKKKWCVSIGAMGRRCKEAGIMDEMQYTNFNKQISFKKWRKKEPLDDEYPAVSPRLFFQSFNLLIKEKVLTKEEIVDHFKWSENDLIDVCGLPTNFFNRTDNPFSLSITRGE